MMSAALVHMLIQDLNWSFKLNSYEKYLEEYPEYKKLINILGKHYFETKDDEITFLLDESKLNELLTNDESTKYIKEFFNITKNNKQDKNTNNKFICNKCQNTFTRKADLTRHNLNSKCGKLNNALNIKQCQGINKLTLEQINMLYPKNNILKNIN